MTHSLSISDPSSDKTAIKKRARKAMKKVTGHHPQKHVGSGHEDKHKHDAQAERRRAYLHLSRASSLLAVFPRDSSQNELQNLYLLCGTMFEAKDTSSTAVAECARALEHLCFASLTAVHSVSIHTRKLTKEQKLDFDRHVRHDFEKQTDRLEEAKTILFQGSSKQRLSENTLLELARRSLAAAERRILMQDWHLAHEFLRATDAITKALDDLS